MRTLEMLSESSLTKTVPRPWNAEPSRRMTHASFFLGLEGARVDRLETRLIDREPLQRAVDGHHGTGRIRPHVALRGHAVAIRRQGLDLGHAGDGRELARNAGAFGLHLDHEAGAKHLHGKLCDRAHHLDTPRLE